MHTPTGSAFQRILRAPELNLALFAFLINFVYEVWQTPYYNVPERSDPQAFVTMLFHCTLGDVLITFLCGLAVSVWTRNRFWVLQPTPGHLAVFTALTLLVTAITESYRFWILRSYGVPPFFSTPVLGTSWLALLQWLVLPPVVALLARRHLLGYCSGHRP